MPRLKTFMFLFGKRFTQSLFVVSLVVSCINHSHAQEAASSEDEDNILTRAGSVVDSVQKNASDRFNNWILQVDDFIGGDQTVSEINQSWARIRLDAIEPGVGDLEAKATVKLRLVLPRSEKRFRLLLSTEDDDASNDASGAGTTTASGEEQDVSLALRFIRTAKLSGSLNFDVGARVRDTKGETFARISASWVSEAGNGWYSKVTNNLFYYHAAGYENRLRYDLRKPWFDSESVFFRSSTDFNWLNGRKGAALSETIGVYAQINPRTALAGEAIFKYSTAFNGDAPNLFEGSELRLRFRQNVWRPYFFYELWPSVTWPSTNDFEAAYGGLVRVEFVIGDTS